jgi:hypothetical protein
MEAFSNVSNVCIDAGRSIELLKDSILKAATSNIINAIGFEI